MYYIGISAYYHESSVFLTDNKGTDCFVKEESFSRIKGDKNFPQRCLKFLIKKFDLNSQLHAIQILTRCSHAHFVSFLFYYNCT